jgi:hypothetical protein
MMKRIISAILMVTVLPAYGSIVHAYKVDTHRRLNESAAEASSASVYLTGDLGFERGLDERFNEKTVLDWIRLGGEFEDNGLRFLRHFHNPLAPSWEDAGFLNSFSSILWAQRPPGEQGWSWHDARDSYDQAWTSAGPEERETAFADTFQALGQVIHLIEDASVPAHSRDDAHPGGYRKT